MADSTAVIGTLSTLSVAWGVGMSILYWRTNAERRDLLTDMTQLIYDGRIEGKNLRRSRGIDAIEDYLEKAASDGENDE